MATPMPGRTNEQRYDPAAIPPRESPQRKSFRQGLEDKLNNPKYAEGKKKFKADAVHKLNQAGSDPVKQFLAIIAVIRMGRQMRKNGEMSNNSTFLNLGRRVLLTGMNIGNSAVKGVCDVAAVACAASDYFTGASKKKNSREPLGPQPERTSFRPR